MNANNINTGSTHDDLGKFVLQEDYLQSLYAITQHWYSDIKFFEGELSFFSTLIDKHLLLLIDATHVEKSRLMVSHVINLKKVRASLEDKIALHIKHIAELGKNRLAQKMQHCSEEHAALEVEFSSFVKKFRSVKSEVFKLTTHVIHSEKVKQILT